MLFRSRAPMTAAELCRVVLGVPVLGKQRRGEPSEAPSPLFCKGCRDLDLRNLYAFTPVKEWHSRFASTDERGRKISRSRRQEGRLFGSQFACRLVLVVADMDHALCPADLLTADGNKYVECKHSSLPQPVRVEPRPQPRKVMTPLAWPSAQANEITVSGSMWHCQHTNARRLLRAAETRLLGHLSAWRLCRSEVTESLECI